MNNWQKLSTAVFIALIVVFVGGISYFGARDWGGLSIVFVVFPLSLILLMVGFSFFILGNSSAAINAPKESTRFFRNRTNFLLVLLISLILILAIYYSL